jgi:hypothetical protein
MNGDCIPRTYIMCVCVCVCVCVAAITHLQIKTKPEELVKTMELASQSFNRMATVSLHTLTKRHDCCTACSLTHAEAKATVEHTLRCTAGCTVRQNQLCIMAATLHTRSTCLGVQLREAAVPLHARLDKTKHVRKCRRHANIRNSQKSQPNLPRVVPRVPSADSRVVTICRAER